MQLVKSEDDQLKEDDKKRKQKQLNELERKKLKILEDAHRQSEEIAVQIKTLIKQL